MMSNPEQSRLLENQAGKANWKRWGSLSQRTRVGHRARRLQRKRWRLKLFSSRSRSVACLSLERRRHGELLRWQAAPMWVW